MLLIWPFCQYHRHFAYAELKKMYWINGMQYYLTCDFLLFLLWLNSKSFSETSICRICRVITLLENKLLELYQRLENPASLCHWVLLTSRHKILEFYFTRKLQICQFALSKAIRMDLSNSECEIPMSCKSTIIPWGVTLSHQASYSELFMTGEVTIGDILLHLRHHFI